MEQTPKIHPAWLVMIGCCLLMATCFALPATCATLFIKPVCEALGFERGQFVIYVSIMSLIQLISMPMAGKILAKYNSRLIISICVVLMGASFCFLSQASALIHWYIAAAVMGIITPLCTVVGVAVIISNWFKDRLGLAMGITMASSGLGAAVLSPIVISLITNLGWQQSYLIIGIFTIIVALPLSATVLRFHPSEIGIRAYEIKGKVQGKPADAGPDVTTAEQLKGPMLAEAVKSPVFYLLLVVTILFGFAASINTHAAPLVGDVFGAVMAGIIVSVIMLSVTGGKVLLGWINDRFGIIPSVSTGCLAMAFGVVLLTIASATVNVFLVYGAGVALGLGLATVTVEPPLLIAAALGNKDYASIFPVIMMGFTIGAAAGAPILGMVYDASGSYTSALGAIALCAVIALILAIMAANSGKKLLQKTA
ncbi:MFS transporter [Syntrophomonas curvata]